MRHVLLYIVVCVAGLLTGCRQEVKVRLLQTTDLHGHFFPYDFITGDSTTGSLSRVASVIETMRADYGNRLLLVDNGDLLQGQPTAYYYNFIDTTRLHLAAEMLNYLGFTAGNVGNHDIETGHRVYDRWASQCQFPVLGANIIDTLTNQPYFKPYTLVERDGVKIAILGMITPAVPTWLSETLWSGLRFDDMEETARRWMPLLREELGADVVVGLFHSGQQATTMSGGYREHASLEVAQRVPGFDVVLIGHDHRTDCKQIANCEGDSVWIVNAGSNGNRVSDVAMTFRLDGGKVSGKQITCRLIDTHRIAPSATFLNRFAPQADTIRRFVSERIGRMNHTISSRDAYFGPSAFVDLIHQLQLSISGAEVSFVAPLSYDVAIEEGDICVSDMFQLYKYENMLYTMQLTGSEIKGALEYSYDKWIARMSSPADHLLRLVKPEGKEKAKLEYYSFNFDSAAGLRYEVDVTRPYGSRVRILSMADGTPFRKERTYRVAVNSYRGNGGGELLTVGAGIEADKLGGRILSSTDKDLRYYLMQYIRRVGEIDPKPMNLWHFVPEAWTIPAARRDRQLLFPGEQN